MTEAVSGESVSHSSQEFASAKRALSLIPLRADPDAAAAKKSWPERIRPTIKRGFDICAAFALLVLSLPVMVVIGMLVLCDDGWPFLYAHKRIGRGGCTFDCLKFRTMRRDAEKILVEVLATSPDIRAEWAATGKIRHDPRVIRIGRLLRSSSLDELPQLLNVLRGDMSLVGPRPIVSRELQELYASLGAAAAYVAVRPGLTGPWQVSGRSKVAYAERVRLDTEYATRLSLRTDLKILARTVKVVLTRDGAC